TCRPASKRRYSVQQRHSALQIRQEARPGLPDRAFLRYSESTQVRTLSSETTGASLIRPPMTRRPLTPPPINGPRFNEFIQSPKVLVIDQDGANLGVMYTREAM